MTTERDDPATDRDAQPGEEPSTPAPTDSSALSGMFRALRIFLVPFLFSWALAYVGSARGAEWLYFAGRGGVLISMLALMVWIIS